MKKNLLAILALVVALVAVGVSLFAVSTLNTLKAELDTRLTELELANAQLRLEQDASAGSPAAVELGDWSLEPRPWEDGTGADVVFVAAISGAPEANSVFLDVTLDGKDVATYPCSKNSMGYTATANLPAQNGYCYTCLIRNPDGTMSEHLLTSPEVPTDPLCIYLEDALSAYCNLLVEDWTLEGDVLTVVSAFTQAVVPQISADGSIPGVDSARLVLKLDDAQIGAEALSMTSGESSFSYEQDVTDIAFTLPELSDSSELGLWLEVTLTDGRTLSACGANWYPDGDSLMLVSG